MKYLCIHSHFYQPPRENPWLEAIELQDSAYPYHDWNERINAECYAPNGASRVLDGQERISQIVNNYSQISYNFGPTLLSWLQEKAPGTYGWVLEADRESAARFSGHGSAIAQAYNHIIMPLANRRDKITQIRWGIRDFLHRFRRPPEGMWLPETAADNETLDIMAEHGIKFTILAPYQCRRVRKIGSRSWRDTAGGRIDPTVPYRVKLPSHRTIDVFFYDGPISRAVAFERLLENGERFANRLLDSVPAPMDSPKLIHIATDGETYGHHHRHGEMALSYALRHVQQNGLAHLTNYGEFLENHPPTQEVEIFENTAWSCSHGVERWNSNCSCNTGGRSDWNQEWRRPLRDALDWLRDHVAPLFGSYAASLLRDPWAARNDYIQVVLDRSADCRTRFLRQHTARTLSPDEEVRAWKLLELQRHAMLMYTSCGWFFDELSGIETVQVIQYAGRMVQLAGDLFGKSVEGPFLERLAQARSNLPEHGDGRLVYEKFVRPAMVDLRKVGAHYAISSIFERGDRTRVDCYEVSPEDHHILQSGSMRLAVGRARFTSNITRESESLTYGVLHFGDHNVTGGVREFRGQDTYEALVDSIRHVFGSADVPEILRVLDAGFGKNVYSLKTLFKDEQRKITRIIIDSSLDDAGDVFRQLFDRYAPLMSFLADLDVPMPKAFQNITEYAINSRLRRALSESEIDIERMRELFADAKTRKAELDATTLEFSLRRRMESLAEQIEGVPGNMQSLRQFDELLTLAKQLPFTVSLWGVQNSCYRLIRGTLPYYRRGAGAGATRAAEWLDLFTRVCSSAGVLLP